MDQRVVDRLVGRLSSRVIPTHPDCPHSMESASSHRNRCDVHVIVDETHTEFHQQCLDSLKDEPINLHLIPGTPGHIGVGRYAGFSAGSAEFVSFVDDDDYIIPGIFQKCYDVLDRCPDACGVITKEQRLHEGTLYPPVEIPLDQGWVNMVKRMHHIVMVRREVVEPFIPRMKKWAFQSEDMLWSHLIASGHKFEILDEVGYIWRLHEKGAHKLMVPSEELKKELKKLYEGSLRPVAKGDA